MKRSFLALPSVAAILICLSPCLRAQNGANTASVTIQVNKTENTISPRLYGQFVEIMFGGVDGSLWGELVRNRSFEDPPNAIGLSRYWEREPDDRNHDPAIHFQWDAKEFYPLTVSERSAQPAQAQHSMGIEVRPDQWNAEQRRGISQGRIPVRGGVPYRGYMWLKTAGFQGKVTAALEQDRTEGKSYAIADLQPTGDNWAKYEFTLTPTGSDPLAKLSILVHGHGKIWIDQVSLLPGDAVAGTPIDIFKRMQDLRPAFVRWPGGNVAQDYHWMRGVGPRDQRPTWRNRAWWNETETGDFGTDEFIAYCRALGTEPSITVNVEGSGATADEAAAWVEYANGPATSKYGSMRAANGHPEPYHVKLWEVGNEVFGPWEIGHSDAATYAQNFLRYAKAMKGVDPGIRLIAVGHDLAWNTTLVQAAGPQIDEIATHFYYGQKEMHGDLNNLLAHPYTLNEVYARMRDMLRRLAPDGHIKLNVNEWNTALPVPAQHTMKSALYAGNMLNGFESNADVIGTTAVSDFVNGWSAGIIQASRWDTFVTPTYRVNKLYNDHLGVTRVSARVQGPTFDSTLQGRGHPVVNLIAERSADGRELYVKAVNNDLQNAITLQVQIDGAHVVPQAELESVTAASPDAETTFAHPEAVGTRTVGVQASDRFSVQLPGDSVSVLTLHLDGNSILNVLAAELVGSAFRGADEAYVGRTEPGHISKATGSSIEKRLSSTICGKLVDSDGSAGCGAGLARGNYLRRTEARRSHSRAEVVHASRHWPAHIAGGDT